VGEGVRKEEKMRKVFKVDDTVVIQDNAFEGTDDPNDYLWRGKTGVVVSDMGNDCYEVYVEGMGTCPLVAKEMLLQP
jgi:ribosomal protein L21E